ncbi:MAG TPA: hypothetical protein PLX66_01180 [Bacilli bacterium]|nr:hypothetical protein [Bacilli bacterium]
MKNKKWVLFIIGVLIILNVGFFVYQMFLKNANNEINETKILDTIENYDYSLEDRDSNLYKEEFNNLKQNLAGDEINYDEYAESVAKLYIIDLYTLNNKLNKYDVGGKEFIYSKALDNYILKVEDTLYKYIEDNTYDQRDQELPTVKSIEVTNDDVSTYIIDDTTYDSYEITLNWEYETDNEYDTSAIVTIIKVDNKLVIVEENRVE